MSKRILIIDDDDMMRGAVAATLSSSDYEIIESRDGKDGLEQARSRMPDLIVCDINMPQLDGFELLQELRKSENLSNIPLIFLTGQTSKEDLRKGMMLGAEDYLTKPVLADELLHVVEVRLKKRESLQRQMQTKLEELQKSISLSLPHEFRTPLTGILGFAEILKESRKLSEEESAYIGTHIHKSARRLQQLLEKILLMAELHAEEADPSRVKFLRALSCPIGIVISQRIEVQALELGRKSDVRLSIEDARVRVQENHFSRAIEELIDNAMKFSGKGTPLTVETSIRGDRAIIAIENKGKGITREQIQRVGAFVQFDRQRHEQQGTGLGLGLVKKIAELYDGSLSIESPDSAGTRVVLTLPLAE